MCEQLGPVRSVLAKFSDRQVSAAADTAREREDAAKRAGDKRNAGIFAKVAEEAERELADRALASITRSIVREGARADWDAASLLRQMMTG
jgi:hypothetical protein